MRPGPASPNDWRYETKFVVPFSEAHALERALLHHPAGFAPAYPARRINNIYLDTPDRSLLQESLSGSCGRLKLRIRWYGSREDAARPALEVKIKEGQLGTKLRFDLPGFRLGAGPSWPALREAIRGLALPGGLKDLAMAAEPVLFNSYWRRYSRSFDRRYMFTVDSGIASAGISPLLGVLEPRPDWDRGLVVELKYDGRHHAGSAAVLRRFPFRASRNSKFLRGMAAA